MAQKVFLQIREILEDFCTAHIDCHLSSGRGAPHVLCYLEPQAIAHTPRRLNLPQVLFLGDRILKQHGCEVKMGRRAGAGLGQHWDWSFTSLQLVHVYSKKRYNYMLHVEQCKT